MPVTFLARDHVEAMSIRLFGHVLAPEAWCQATGAPPDAMVLAEPDESGEIVVVRAAHRLIRGVMLRRFARSRADGAVIARNVWFERAPDAPRFTGSRIFARQAEALRRLGVGRIETEAAGGPGLMLNGYYTWPRLGFNAPLTPDEQRRLPPHLAGATDLHTLITRAGGLSYWREHGTGREMVFDLAPESDHSAILTVYLEVNGIHVHDE